MEFIPAQLQPSPMTMAIVVCTISALWWMDRGAVLRGMNLKLHFEEELDPAKKYVFGVHPHSILPWGSIVNLLTDVNNKESNGFHDKFSFTQLHAGGASVCFCIPVYRELCLAGGCIEATRPVMDKALEQADCTGFRE
ncbi:hypothetical protein T484DRAFT_1776553 [Baffinella frigidus]|nr:hypothetical protein T484DRAFT_1776553 [Cryptophyta sp. CCMP2293]